MRCITVTPPPVIYNLIFPLYITNPQHSHVTAVPLPQPSATTSAVTDGTSAPQQRLETAVPLPQPSATTSAVTDGTSAPQQRLEKTAGDITAANSQDVSTGPSSGVTDQDSGMGE